MQLIAVRSMRPAFFVATCLALLGCGQGRDPVIAEGGGRESTSGGEGGRAGEGGEGLGGTTLDTSTAGAGGDAGSSIVRRDPITLGVAYPVSRVRPGDSSSIGVVVWQKGKGDWDIHLSARGLPEGVTATPISVGNSARGAHIPVQVAPTAPIGGPYRFEVVAKSDYEAVVQGEMYITAPPGGLDTSWGGTGVISLADVLPPQRQTDAPREYARDATFDTNGRILVGGYSSQSTDQGWVLRLSRDGSLDKTFGQGGIVSDFGAPESRVLGVTLLRPNNGLYVGAERTDTSGTTSGYLRVLNESGLGQPWFNGGSDMPLAGSPTAMSVFFYDELLAVSAGAPHVYTSKGEVEESFSSTEIGAKASIVEDTLRSLVFGRVVDNKSFEVGRLLESGAPDPAFGSNGLVPISCPEAKPLALSIRVEQVSDDVFALVDCANGPTAADAQSELVAFSRTGEPLTTFGASGRLLVVPAGRGAGVVSDISENLFVLGQHVGTAGSGSELRTQVSVVQHEGVFDAAFGNGGTVNVPYVEEPVMVYERGAERIVVIGSAPDSGGGVLKMTRIWL